MTDIHNFDDQLKYQLQKLDEPDIDNCPQCQTTLRGDPRFCPRCGLALGQKVAYDLG